MADFCGAPELRYDVSTREARKLCSGQAMLLLKSALTKDPGLCYSE